MIPTIPTLMEQPFATGGTKHTIPNTNNISLGLASYQDGFPPVTALPVKAGGIPPNREDFNGILHDLSSHLFWQQSGGAYPWSAALNYPVNAIVFASDNKQYKSLQVSGIDVGVIGAKDPVSEQEYWVNMEDAHIPDLNLHNTDADAHTPAFDKHNTDPNAHTNLITAHDEGINTHIDIREMIAANTAAIDLKADVDLINVGSGIPDYSAPVSLTVGGDNSSVMFTAPYSGYLIVEASSAAASWAFIQLPNGKVIARTYCATGNNAVAHFICDARAVLVKDQEVKYTTHTAFGNSRVATFYPLIGNI